MVKKIIKTKTFTTIPPTEVELEVQHFESLKEAIDKLGESKCLHLINYYRNLTTRCRWRNKMTGANHVKKISS